MTMKTKKQQQQSYQSCDLTVKETFSTVGDNDSSTDLESNSSRLPDDSFHHQDLSTSNPESGSSVLGAALNFTNSIVGAGCLGYGSAVAESGGLFSVAIIVVFAILTKASYDMLIQLGVDFRVTSYEALAWKSCGAPGRITVIVSKAIFAFGGMVAFMVVIRDNFSPACLGLLRDFVRHNHAGDDADDPGYDWSTNVLSQILGNETWTTILLCTFVVLPLSLQRDVSFLERFSGAKIFIFVSIVITVIYFYFTLLPLPSNEALSFSDKWLAVKPGAIKSMGTFIYGFVAQHTVHMVFRSLSPSQRNMKGWEGVSTISLSLAFTIFLSLGMFSYMTFWDETSSNLFREYPEVPLVSVAQLCLSIAILFTYPMNLLSLRELIIESFLGDDCEAPKEAGSADALPTEADSLLGNDSTETECSEAQAEANQAKNAVDAKDLSWTAHATLTTALWLASLLLAITPASLGDVLNLIGCISGSLIAFILPALFSYQLHGYSSMVVILMASGCFVGFFGTYFGLKDMLS